ncbi:MAG: ATP-binding cassette domain-containing protein [Candidatus Eisenbacteria bacterium]|nr:ATP-binding cassette domain-containing protein [Candidatus Eisenbacteria bacterium]
MLGLSPDARLVLDGLTHTHPGSPGPRPLDVSGEVRRGEWVCLAGPNGSGKSTLLRTAAGLLRPDSGTVRICPGHPASAAAGGTSRGDLLPGDRAFRRGLGYLSQLAAEQVLGATVADELASGLEWHGVPPAEIRVRVTAALGELAGSAAGAGGGWAHRTASALSAGERRRVALASVILPGPGFLVADEPLAELDPFARADWLRRIGELKAGGLGLLTATTSAAEASRADRVWLLDPRAAGIREVSPASLGDPAIALAAGLRPAPPAELDLSDLGTAAAVGGPGSTALAWLRGARLARGATTVWEALDLGVPDSGLAAFHGRNGSGKSTLARALSGLLRPASGSAGGAIGWDGPAHSRRCRSAMAFQSPEDQLGQPSVREELTPPRGFAGRAAAPADLLSSLGLGPAEFLDRPPLALSSGERRRVALASLAALDPALLLLDEPLCGLDGPGSAAVAGWLMAQSRERTVWLFSSDLDVPEIPSRHWVGIGAGRPVPAALEPPRPADLGFHLPWAYGFVRGPGPEGGP